MTSTDDSFSVIFTRSLHDALPIWYFDPTVMPLINYWGFGYEGHRPVENIDSARVDSLKQLVGFDRVKNQPTASMNPLWRYLYFLLRSEEHTSELQSRGQLV